MTLQVIIISRRIQLPSKFLFSFLFFVFYAAKEHIANLNLGNPIVNRSREDVSDKLLCLIMLAIYLDKFKKF